MLFTSGLLEAEGPYIPEVAVREYLTAGTTIVELSSQGKTIVLGLKQIRALSEAVL